MNLTDEMKKQLLETRVAFIERTGVKALELERGHVKLMAPLKGNENHIGTMYAGALFTVAEVVVGALWLASFDVSKYYPIIKEMTIRYLRVAKSDVTIELTISEEQIGNILEEVEEEGKAEFVLEGEVKDVSGEVVATSRGVYQMRSFG
ncbi:MAG: YiiD C-terminal domain-containing protein [Deltaproteobacteria bacterium]|nr:YiiD C-terminal domain-containing protein [Deltaproteobacteria bacterium]